MITPYSKLYRLIAKTLLLITFTFNLSFSQNKDALLTEGAAHQMTVSMSEMYSGSKSKAAKKYFKLAYQLSKRNDFNTAKKQYLKAIKKDPKFVEAYDNLGLVFRNLEDYDNAIKYYKESILLYPEGKLAYQNLGKVYSFKEEYTNALNQYQTILTISPGDPEGYFGIANSCMMLSKFDDALTYAKKALQRYELLNSNRIGDSYYMVGLIHYYKGDKTEAKEYLKLAKDKGAKLNTKLEKEFFSNENKAD